MELNDFINVSVLSHNECLINDCEKILNSFINENAQIWFTDSEVHCFVPKGNVKIGYYQISSICEDK